MATISSHVLDSVIGTHAAGIRVECYSRSSNDTSDLLFDVVASAEGRISENILTSSTDTTTEYELVFHSADYYQSASLPDDGYQILNKVVLRITLPESDANYHLPIMLSPHSYSVWWSGNPDTAGKNKP